MPRNSWIEGCLLKLVLVVLLFLETERVVWCDTCDSEKAKTLVMCACARENLDKTSSCFQLLMIGVVVAVVDGCYQNDGSFCSKRRVVL